MTRRVVWRRTAEQDVVEAAVYLAERAPAVTERFLSAVDLTVRRLATSPGTGRPRSFEDPGLAGLRTRVVAGFRSYVVFYLPRADGIEVLRVLHGARDIDAIFEREVD